jgi:ATP-binding cassette subfamily B protein
VTAPEGGTRLVRSLALFRALVSVHPLPFWVATGSAAVYSAGTIASSVAVSFVVDEVILPAFEAGGRPRLAVGCTLIIGIGLVRAVAVVGRRSFAGLAQWRTAETLAQRVIGRILTQPPAWRRERMSGDLVARAGADSDTAVIVMGPMPFGTSVLLLLVLTGAWLVVVDRPLGAAAAAVIPLLLVVNVGYQRRIDRHYARAQDELGRLSEAVLESFDGVAVVKAFGAEERETARLATIASRLRDARIRAVRGRATFEGILDAAPAIINVGIILLGAVRVRDGALTVGELSSFIYLFTLLLFPLRIIGYVFSELPHSLGGWTRVAEVVDDPIRPDPAGSIAEPPPGFAVVVDGVTVTHPGADRPALHGASVAIRRGTTVAVVGPTGSGKTTLLATIAGLVATDSGRIAVAGGRAALVQQEPFLFQQTLRGNVTLDDPTIDDARVRRALWTAAADDFVDALPAGTGTEVGERGAGLSGGQRQRIALARALAHDSDVVLLDDTTSSLDPQTESTVVERLKASGRTLVVVASRPSTIALADEVVWLVDGEIRATGSHADLLARDPGYRAIVEAHGAS